MSSSIGEPSVLVGRTNSYEDAMGLEWDAEHSKIGHVNIMIVAAKDSYPTGNLNEIDPDKLEGIFKEIIAEEMTEWAINNQCTGSVELADTSDTKKEEKGTPEEEGSQGEQTEEVEKQEEKRNLKKGYDVEKYNLHEAVLTDKIKKKSEEEKSKMILKHLARNMGALIIAVDHLDLKYIDTGRSASEVEDSIKHNIQIITSDGLLQLNSMRSNLEMPGKFENGEIYVICWTDKSSTGLGTNVVGWSLEKDGKPCTYTYAAQCIRLIAYKCKNNFKALGIWTTCLQLLESAVQSHEQQGTK